MAKHNQLVEPYAIHPFAFVGATDPSLDADNEIEARKAWVDTSGGLYRVKLRNEANNAWINLSNAGIGARVRRTTTQAISSATVTYISFDTEVFDTGGFWVVGSPTRLTVAEAGLYIVQGNVRFSTVAASLNCYLIKNGATSNSLAQAFYASSGTDNISQNITAIVQLAAADYVELAVWASLGCDVLGDASDRVGLSIARI